MYPDQNQDPNNPRVISPNAAPPQSYNDTYRGGGAPSQPGGWQSGPQPVYPAPQPAAPPAQQYGPPVPPLQPAEFVQPDSGGSRFSPLRLIMLILIILIVLAGLGVGGYFLYKHFTDKPPVVTKKVVPTALPANNLCSQAGTAIICQDFATGTALKYNPPHAIGAAYAILPSPDDAKVFIDTPANTVENPAVSDHFYIYDKQLKLLKQLPDEKSTEDYLGFDWTADSKSLVYAKREMNDQKQFGKASLYVYNMDSGETKKLAGGDNYDLSVPQAARDGETVYVENNAGIANGTLSLAAVNLSSGQLQTIATGTVMQSMQSFTTYTYSRINNLFYVSGVSAATGQPIFIVAKLVTNAGNLQLQTVKVLDNGYAYTPLTSTADGMIVSRTQKDQTDYGLVKADGTFAAMEVNPTNHAAFGLANPFDVKAAATSAATAQDFLFIDTQKSVSSKLQSFLKKLVTKDCAKDTFSTVALLGHDGDKQAAVHFTPCDSTNDRTQYYVSQGDSYKNVLETQATTIPCTTMAKLKLTKAIVPSCSKS